MCLKSNCLIKFSNCFSLFDESDILSYGLGLPLKYKIKSEGDNKLTEWNSLYYSALHVVGLLTGILKGMDSKGVQSGLRTCRLLQQAIGSWGQYGLQTTSHYIHWKS